MKVNCQYSDGHQEKKAPLCPKLSRMSALLQGGGTSSDGSTVTKPCVAVYFQCGNTLSTGSSFDAMHNLGIDLSPWYTNLTYILDDLNPYLNKVNRSIDSKVISKNRKLQFYCYYLDLEPLTLILKPNLDIIVINIKNEVNRSISSKVIIWKQ